MSDTAGPLKSVTLDPGEFHFGSGPTRIATLLGSCISITLWHPLRRIGGMCHYLLAERPANVPRTDAAAPDGRYACEAFAFLLQQIEAAGTCPGEYQAKLFGGGNMFAGRSNGAMDIGLRNIERGRELLAASQIALVAEHVGGNGRRKLHFDLRSGHVWLAFPEGSNAYIRNAHG